MFKVEIGELWETVKTQWGYSVEDSRLLRIVDMLYALNTKAFVEALSAAKQSLVDSGDLTGDEDDYTKFCNFVYLLCVSGFDRNYNPDDGLLDEPWGDLDRAVAPFWSLLRYMQVEFEDDGERTQPASAVLRLMPPFVLAW